MKANIEIEVPLEKKQSSFAIPEPCTYCGQEVAKTSKLWELNIPYNYMGQQESGSVTLQAPYCRKHENTPLLPFWLVVLSSVVGGGLGFYLSSFLADSIFDLTSLSKSGLWMVKVGVWLSGGGMLLLFAWGSHKLLTLLIPAWRDIPLSFSGGGNWGLQIAGVRVDGDAKGDGLVSYFLPIKFVNVESAQRFLEAYPSARVVKGKELL